MCLCMCETEKRSECVCPHGLVKSLRPPAVDQRFGTVVSGSMAGSLATAVGRSMVTLSLCTKSFTAGPVHVKIHCVKLNCV